MSKRKGHWGKTVRGTWAWHREDLCSPEAAERSDREARATIEAIREVKMLDAREKYKQFLRAQEDAEAARVLAEMDEADMAEADAYYASVDPLPVYRRPDAGGERKWWLTCAAE